MRFLAVLDGNGIAARYYYAAKTRGRAVVPTALIKLLERVVTNFHATDVLVAWDNATSWRRRRAIFSGYKQNRAVRTEEERQDKERYLMRVHETMALLSACGVDQASAPDIEADDVIAYVASPRAGYERVIVFATDKDILQLVSSRVSVFNPFTAQLTTEANFERIVGMPQAWLLDYYAMVGDTTDGVPGVYGVGDKRAREWLAAYGTIEGIVTRATKPKAALANLRASADALTRNRQLIDLLWVEALSDVPIHRGVYDPGLVRRLCEELGMFDVLETLGTYLAVADALQRDRRPACVGL